MVEKFAAGIALVLSIILGTWAKMTFVRRSEIYKKDGQPVYQHADLCRANQQACNKIICSKIDELKTAHALGEKNRNDARDEMQQELGAIKIFMGRVEQYMKDHG